VGPLDGRDALAKTMVFLVWNFTAANASLTRASYDAYAYPPARPTVLHAPPPPEKVSFCPTSELKYRGAVG
jgi:hypothetical protein